MFGKLTRITLAGVLGLGVAIGGVAVPAYAGEDTGMCDENHDRGTIPGDFPLKACFDGKTMRIRNNTQFPLVISFSGDTVESAKLDAKASGGASRLIAYVKPGFGKQQVIGKPDVRSGIVPPGFESRATVGDGEVKIKITTAGPDIQKAYVIGEIIWQFLPVEVPVEVMKAVAELSRELADVGMQYLECMDRNKDAWGDLGCRALLGRNVAFAYGRVVVNGLGAGVVKALISLFTTAKWADSAAGDLIKLKDGTREFKIAAVKKPDPPVNTGGGNNSGGGNSGSGGNTGGSGNSGGNNGGGSDNPPPPPPPPAKKYATVQNMHLAGGSGLEEDSTPAYLSTEARPRCKANGCAIGGTDMWSGETVEALCTVGGSEMTNENRNRADDDNNPNKITTTRWLRARKNGQEGLISLIYLTPGSRDLVGAC